MEGIHSPSDWGNLIGALLFGESITLRMGLGITICVAAVVFMILKPGKKS